MWTRGQADSPLKGSEDGQALVEYGLISLVLVALVTVGVVLLSGSIGSNTSHANHVLATAAAQSAGRRRGVGPGRAHGPDRVNIGGPRRGSHLGCTVLRWRLARHHVRGVPGSHAGRRGVPRERELHLIRVYVRRPRTHQIRSDLLLRGRRHQRGRCGRPRQRRPPSRARSFSNWHARRRVRLWASAVQDSRDQRVRSRDGRAVTALEQHQVHDGLAISGLLDAINDPDAVVIGHRRPDGRCLVDIDLFLAARSRCRSGLAGSPTK